MGKMNEKCLVKNCCPFIVMMSSVIFDPVSVPGREREQRLRICKITSPKGKRKNAGTNNLKQEEKTILKIIKKKNRNKRLKQFLTRIKVLK